MCAHCKEKLDARGPLRPPDVADFTGLQCTAVT
jgi:hypothetical protein